MSEKPKVFIASSGNGIKMVKALRHVFEKEGLDVDPWMAPEQWINYPLPDLLKRANGCHYAVCVVWPDDELKNPKENGAIFVPRDNVIFEAGLFTGVLNRDFWSQAATEEKRVYYWINNAHGKTVHRPTDLNGLNEERYDFSGKVDSDTIESIADKIEVKAQALARKISDHWITVARPTSSSPIQKTFLKCFQREWITEPPDHQPLVFKPKELLFDENDVYDSLVHEGADAQSVAIAVKDTRWIWDLFPLVLHWRRRGIPVSVAAPVTTDPHDAKRRSLLEGLGCLVSNADVKEGLFVIDPGPSNCTRVFRFQNEKHCCARLITRSDQTEAVEAVDDLLETYRVLDPISDFVPTIEQADVSEIIEKLKSPIHGPGPYKRGKVMMEMADIELTGAYSISMSARTYRFRQTPLLSDSLAANGISHFDPAKVLLRAGRESLITPPVVEVWGEKSVFLEGNTRALYSRCNGVSHIRALRVTGVSTQLPATEIPLDEVFLCRLKLPAVWRQLKWDYDAFRDIEGAIHNH